MIVGTEVQETGGKAESKVCSDQRGRQKEDCTAICNCLTEWGEAVEVGSSGSDMMEQEGQAMARDILLCGLPSSQGSGLEPREFTKSLSLEVLGQCCAAFSWSPLLRAGPAFPRALHWCQSVTPRYGPLWVNPCRVVKKYPFWV